MSDGKPSIDEMLDRAVAAINRGDRLIATELAEKVLSVDARNPDADAAARHADLAAARDLARRQGAPVYELRSALDDLHFRGQAAHTAVADALSRLPADSAVPERQRAVLMLSTEQT